MRIVEQSFEILTPINGEAMLKRIEGAGRTCYKSEDRITEDSAQTFVTMVLKRGHETVIEHESISVRFICNRGVTHELVRHRLASYSQESTRYCNYSQDKHDNEVTFIDARPWLETELMREAWIRAMTGAETQYLNLLRFGCKPQIARGVLPIDLKTEIVCTANLREWRHIFRLRTAPDAHPHIRALMQGLLAQLRKLLPVIFDDVGEVPNDA